MGRERIHKLAADWGVKSKDIIERLEKMGIKGKKAQSVLDEGTAERVRAEMGVGPDPLKIGQPKVVDERVVEAEPSDSAAGVKVYKTITETRVRAGVVLRRTRRTEVQDGETGAPAPRRRLPTGGAAAPTAVALSPEQLAAFDPAPFGYASVPTNGHVVAPAEAPIEAEAAPVIERITEPPTTPAAPVEVEPAEPVQEAAAEPVVEEEEEDEGDIGEKQPVAGADKIAEELLSAAEARKAAEVAESEDGGARPSGPRVLGRIDLSKKATPVTPATTKPETPKEPSGEEAGQKAGRKKRRKVVQKEDLFDALERSFQVRPRKKRAAPGQRVKKTEVTTPKASKRVVKINDVTTAGELAKAIGVKSGDVLGSLMRLGAMKSINDPIDIDTATLVADEFGYTVENTAIDVEQLLEMDTTAGGEDVAAEPRPPVVTVMGHVDHGKTSLLDAIRQASVVSSESGGITQHIGAYMVSTAQGDICFLDTPGHAAFTAMRARGASVTDIVVLVVAADDGVMPQTVEAIDHAKAAEIPIIVAVNKMDKPGATPDRVKQQLAEHGVQSEDWGGDTQFIPVSALKKMGIDELLEAISLQAQLLELTAARERRATGTVIEARLDKGLGPVATILVQEGTLERGDVFVCGDITGRVRAMTDHAGQPVEAASPSTPVEITGLEGVPSAGDSFVVVDDPARAQQVAEFRREAARKAQLAASTRLSLEDLQRQVAAGEVSELKVIIKADVRGSAEAVKQALEKLSTPEVALNVIHTGVGAISESDVQLALASNAMVLGFHVRPEAKARALAEREGVDMRLHTVIYEAVDEVKAGLEGLLEPEFKESLEGRADVRDTFSVPGGHTIAGCYVTEGRVARGAQCRLLRDNVVIHSGKVGSLRRFKDDVREVQTGYECGIGIERFNDVKVGDVIECFKMQEIKRTLEQSAATAQAAD